MTRIEGQTRESGVVVKLIPQQPETSTGKVDWDKEQRIANFRQWIANLREFCASQPRLPYEADDSRESIYD